MAEDRRDCYWLYVVTHCNTTPQLREPIRDPARLEWVKVTKVAHYRIDTHEPRLGRLVRMWHDRSITTASELTWTRTRRSWRYGRVVEGWPCRIER